MVALTATATKLTKDTIQNVLMENPYEITETPNKPNITYVVEYMQKDTEHQLFFGWLADELRTRQSLCERTILYCQTIKQCGIIYATIKGLLGQHMYIGNNIDPRNVLVEMLYSCTPAANKQYILHSFQSEDGTIRVLFSTIAFGIGMNCKGVHRVIHYGPSKKVEAYVQETGRDGTQSHAYILYHGILLNHVEGDIKCILKTDDCTRKILCQHFDTVLEQFHKLHLCCDNCAATSECGETDCAKYAAFPMRQTAKQSCTQQRGEKRLLNKRKLLKETLSSITSH